MTPPRFQIGDRVMVFALSCKQREDDNTQGPKVSQLFPHGKGATITGQKRIAVGKYHGDGPYNSLEGDFHPAYLQVDHYERLWAIRFKLDGKEFYAREVDLEDLQ